MKLSRSFALVAALAVATFAGAVCAAQPDMAAMVWHALTTHADLGQLMLATGPVLAGTQLRALKAKKAEHIQAAQALNGITDRDLTADEQQALANHMASIKGLNAQIDAAELLANEAAGLNAAGGVEIGAAGQIHVTDNITNDPRRGFASFGEFARSVRRAQSGAGTDERLRFSAAAPGTASNESAGADGGFAIPPQFSQDIWRLSLEEDSFIPLTENTELGGNSMIFPKDETTPWGGSGVQAYWQNEAAAGSASKLQLTSEALVLHKLFVLAPVTNELLDDGIALGSYLSQVAPGRITWKANEAILFGDGIGKPLGCLNANAGPLIVQTKEGGQTTNTFDPKNFSKMVSRLIAGEMKNAVWIGNPDVLPGLESLTLGQYPIFLPSQNIAGNSYGMLKGRPLWLSEHAAAAWSQGDINLVSFKGYRTITKAGGIQTATSMHLYFDADATAFRFMFRLNGKPILTQAITPPKSSNTRSHFVTLQAR